METVLTQSTMSTRKTVHQEGISFSAKQAKAQHPRRAP